MEPEPEEELPRRRHRRRTSPVLLVFGILLGVLVAVVMCLFIYDRIETAMSRRRLDAIREEQYLLLLRNGDEKRSYELQQEERRILRKHPDWR